MKKDDFDVSVVILSFNSITYIEKCLTDLLLSFKESNLIGQINVVDNGSSDGSVNVLKSMLDKYPNDLSVIFQNFNTGTTQSRNKALNKSKGKYILVLDSDAYMNSVTLNKLVNYLEENSNVGLVAPALIYPDGRFQLSVDVFPTLIRKIKRYFTLRSLEENSNRQNSGAVDYAISACWMLPRSVVDDVGLLDEKIFYSPEDVDYCIRVWKSGYQVHYLPSTRIVHDAQEISRPKGLFINKFTIRHIKGLIYLFIKHRYIFSLNSLYKKINRFSL